MSRITFPLLFVTLAVTVAISNVPLFISATTMLNRSTVLFGERALFAGAVVIIEGNSKNGLNYLSVQFACDPMRTTIAIHVNNLDPISAEEKSNDHHTRH